MAIDSHMHINSLLIKGTDLSIDKINNSSLFDAVINVGMNVETSKESVEISNSNPKFYSTVGIHPLFTKGEKFDELYNLVTDKVVAIGEIGLDKNKDNFFEQRRYLIEQLVIANTLHLPVIIHSNNSNKEVIEIFEKFIKPKYGCVFHCYQPDIEYLDYIIRNGFYISFAGKILQRNANRSIEVAKKIPNELFLVETDSPYLSPDSMYIKNIVQKLADIKDMEYEEVERITSQNTRRLFKKMN